MNPELADKASENYKNLCASCHGQEVNAFADRPKWVVGNTQKEIAQVILKGLLDEGMPAFEAALSEKDANDLATYILNASKEVQSYDFKDASDGLSDVSEGTNLSLSLVTDKVNEPWGMAQLPDMSLLITDKSGKLFYLKTDGNISEVPGVPAVRYRNQGGLLDVILHPDFDSNTILYLSYSKPHATDASLATTAVYMATFNNGRLSGGKDIFIAEPYYSTAHHYGSRMIFDKHGYLFVSVGDRGRHFETAQSLSIDAGKIHRLNWDGSVPDDNPFVNQAEARKSIYSYGHRNPQGLVYDATNDLIYSNEHGPRGGDEINLVKRGANYGWPVITYGINYDGTKITDKTHQDGMEQPLYYWVPSIGVCGMVFVRDSAYPFWEGNLLNGSLKYNYLDRTIISADGEYENREKLFAKSGRMRSIYQGKDGYIYIGYENPGRVYKIVK